MMITYFAGYLWRRFAQVETKHQGAFSAMFTFSNTIFIGLPINLAIFGEKAVPYVLLYYIVNTTLFWTIGIFELAKDNPDFGEARISFHPKKDFFASLDWFHYRLDLDAVHIPTALLC